MPIRTRSSLVRRLEALVFGLFGLLWTTNLAGCVTDDEQTAVKYGCPTPSCSDSLVAKYGAPAPKDTLIAKYGTPAQEDTITVKYGVQILPDPPIARYGSPTPDRSPVTVKYETSNPESAA